MGADRQTSGCCIEQLIACASLDELDRALLDATADCAGLLAAELWRPHGETWVPVLARGARECLPPDELVRAAAEGVIGERLPGGSHVIVNRGVIAMVLAWDGPERHDDRPLGWLALHAAVQASLPVRSSPFSAPLPRRMP